MIDDPSISERAFKWEQEFPDVMNHGGFDVIVGNPPYFNISSEDSLRQTELYRSVSNGVVNSAAIFVMRSILLSKTNGHLGLIIPKSFAYVDSWKKIRNLIYDECTPEIVADVGKAFKDVLLEQVIIVLRNRIGEKSSKVEIVSGLFSNAERRNILSLDDLRMSGSIVFASSNILENMLRKIENETVPLGEISRNFRGIGAQKFVSEKGINTERIISGKEIKGYDIVDYHNYHVPKVLLSDFKKIEDLRDTKIMCQNIVAHIRDHIKITCAYDDQGILTLDTVNNIVIRSKDFHLKYILALLNSRLISHYTYIKIFSGAIRTMHFDSKYSNKIPIKKVNDERQKSIVKIVDKILSLNSQIRLFSSKNSDGAHKLKEEVLNLEDRLNRMIYELYELSDDEISLVEKLYKKQ